MFKKLFVITYIMANTYTIGSDTTRTTPLPAWISTYKKISILNHVRKKPMTSNISKITTIADIIEELENSYVLGEDQYNLTAVQKTWWPTLSGWAQKESEILDTSRTVYDVMAQYNTALFRLHHK